MKRYLFAPLLALLVVLGAPVLASAHVLKVDGSIGAVLHIKPDDNPQSGVVTAYELAFQDETSRFSLFNCDCKTTISQGSKTIISEPLGVGRATVSTNSVTFPDPGVYTLSVSGTPKMGGNFEPFMLQFVVRASGSTTQRSSLPSLLWIGIGMALGLVILTAFALDHSVPKIKGGSS